MIKAIIFDVGGVILDFKPLILPVVKIFHPEDETKFWEDLNLRFIPLCRGEGTLLQFWKDLAKEYEKEIPENTLKKLWRSEFETNLIINKDIIKIIMSLKGKYKLGIISNTIKEHADIFMKNDYFELFDTVILSHEVKMTKDAKDIFFLAIKKLRVKPEECAFIDDIKKFVETSKSVGMNAILFKNPEQLKLELRKLDIKI